MLVPLLLDGFRRITEGRDKGGYFHEFFLQGRKGLVKKVKRKKPSVPKATKEDLDQAARISNEILSSSRGGVPSQYGSIPLAQQMMNLPPQGMPPGPEMATFAGSFASGPFSPPNAGAVSVPAMADPKPENGLAYGGSPYGVQSNGFMRSAPPM